MIECNFNKLVYGSIPRLQRLPIAQLWAHDKYKRPVDVVILLEQDGKTTLC